MSRTIFKITGGNEKLIEVFVFTSEKFSFLKIVSYAIQEIQAAINSGILTPIKQEEIIEEFSKHKAVDLIANHQVSQYYEPRNDETIYFKISGCLNFINSYREKKEKGEITSNEVYLFQKDYFALGMIGNKKLREKFQGTDKQFQELISEIAIDQVNNVL